ncbi:MAG: flagellar hook-basal body protein [Lachnospiraceae bacterium]|jgi:flagellar basal-body rod protein FlgG|nr:flagellar hook-basal body protein [Lachnospiraceae bacterium]MBO6154720.1 flagellar hook-basal body protein [Lachnospiraceae bacterium]MBQ2089159.1 flagellar hook-basal body protein [Lachnospiraceae bacterium]MBQ4300273.1 flagellar hook-basal body protein [Lachnospiraceae bacterium]
MVKGLYTAYTGMVEEQRRLDVTANNMANSATTGYKDEGVVNQSFDHQLAIKIKDTSAASMPRRIGAVTLGVKVGETYTNWDQGSFQITDNDSDLALSGQGFFAIAFTSKDGTTSIKYTRDGAFTIDTEGYMRTSDGDYVLNMNGALNSDLNQNNYVRVNPNFDYTVDKQGYIFQEGNNIGQVGIVDIGDYNYISKYGENMYDLVNGGTIIPSNASIEQGCLEASNVNIVDEMVRIITLSRAYEAGQKMIQTEDSTLEKAANEVGRV